MILDPNAEIRRLFDVEYHDKTEVLIRLAGVSLGAVLLYLYSGWIGLPVIWAALYLLAHGLQYAFLRARLDRAVLRDVHMAGLIFTAVLASFAWLPTMLAMQADSALAYSGITLIIAVVSLLIKRADSIPWVVGVQIGAIWLVFTCILSSKLDEIASTPGRVASVIVSLTVVAYVSKTLVAARQTRLSAEDAANRAAQERKMAAIGQLAGGVAHDFNNALTVIIGNLELNEVLTDPEEKKFVLAEAAAAAIRAKDTVRQLLIFAHKAPSFRKTIQIDDAISAMVALSERLVPDNMQIRTKIAPGMPPVVLDETQFLSVLVNLLTNASDAMPTGGTLTLSSQMVVTEPGMELADGTQLPAGSYLRISFEDTGIGISPEILDRVTEPFFTTKPPGLGTGLGLPMAMSFANESGGGLAISSGKTGTTVSLYLLPSNMSAKASQDGPAAIAGEHVPHALGHAN